MTIDTRTEAERRYDALALSQRSYTQPEAPQYDDNPMTPDEDIDSIIAFFGALERAQPGAPSSYYDAINAAMNEFQQAGPFDPKTFDYDGLIARLEAIERQFGVDEEVERDPYEPFGTLRDGTPIEGHIDERDPTGRCGVVSADIGDWHLVAQDKPNLIDIEGENVRIEGATLEQINALRALLITDAPEQLLAAAVAYGRGDAEPPSWPAPPIRVEYLYHNPNEDGDLTEEPIGPLGFITYSAGEGRTRAEFIVDVSGKHRPYVDVLGGQEVVTEHAEQAARNLVRLLDDPRVIAARAEWKAS